MRLKIGDLAKKAGLSVRALHHYDAIGLLSPSQRTEGGARLYGC
ncbi:merR regulatory family protein [Burkholderia cepacia]|nr:merR regulatory family protein [Burkholderia cepacia]